MRAAHDLGLQVAGIELCTFGEETAVVVERFDRTNEFGAAWVSGLPPRRVHQEDMCQALGLARALKYQADGGPSVGDIANLLEQVVVPRRLEQARRRFAEATVFNWLTAGTDAHAKNYALIHVGGTTVLAPLYDLMSAALVMEEREAYYQGKLAMKLGGQYGIRRMAGVRWRKLLPSSPSIRAGWSSARGRCRRRPTSVRRRGRRGGSRDRCGCRSAVQGRHRGPGRTAQAELTGGRSPVSAPADRSGSMPHRPAPVTSPCGRRAHGEPVRRRCASVAA